MFAIMFRKTIVSDVVQGIILGGVLAFITTQIMKRAISPFPEGRG
jgi:hypothetical protein